MLASILTFAQLATNTPAAPVASAGQQAPTFVPGRATSAPAIDGVIDESIAGRVGLTAQHIEDMYQTMAIANYEDRFVIPTAHREIDEDAYDLRGSRGFTFGNGCSGGTTGTNLFGTPKRAKSPMEVM